MKRMATLLLMVATSLFLSAAAVLSAENGVISEGKDACLLVAMNCTDNVDSLQQRIERLNNEISKGGAVYTQEELRKLNMKLEDTLKQLEQLTSGG